MVSILKTIAIIWRAGAGNVPIAGPRTAFKRLQFLCEAYLHLLQIHAWLNAGIPDILRAELKRSPVLLKALINPYVHRMWTVEERAQRVTVHYRLLMDLQVTFLNFPEDCYWTCAEFVIGEKNFRIVIDRPRWMRSEGEMTVSLFAGVDRVYSIAFLIGGNRQAPCLMVGAIQGMPKTLDESVYADLTKVFHGARPRDLLINVLKMVAKNIGCTEILAISDEYHQSVGRGNAMVKVSKYDTIWLEHGGIRQDSGFFAMSSVVHKRPDAEIPSRKRAQYRRRYELLDMLEKNIEQEFANENRIISRHLGLQKSS